MSTAQAMERAPRWALTLINNLFELDRKLRIHGDAGNASRNLARMKDAIEEAFGTPFHIEDPIGQPFNETRTDLDASIAGTSADDLVVVEVIKPIIRCGTPERSWILQKGIVVVESAARGSEQSGGES